MTGEEFEKKAVSESVKYNTKYSETYSFSNELKNLTQKEVLARLNRLLIEKAYRDGYLAGGEAMREVFSPLAVRVYKDEQRESWNRILQNKELRKENEQLKQQIEKMKCCFNCDKPIKHQDCGDCHNGSNWELMESDRLIRS
jgi:hypothetical protein